jgi:serine/threonine protein kinase
LNGNSDSTLEQEYRLGQKLGAGAFGKVMMGWSKNNKRYDHQLFKECGLEVTLSVIYSYAIKIIDKSSKEFDLPSLEKEIAIMKEVASDPRAYSRSHLLANPKDKKRHQARQRLVAAAARHF